MTTFEELNLSDKLLEAIERMGFTEPTQIQEEAIPPILEGKDVIGQSATGSGKTLAFGAGIVQNCDPNGGVQSVVLVPTRELAEQVKDELRKISYVKDLKMQEVYGGVSLNPQIKGLQHADVVIATPGRLLDHMQRGTVDLSNVHVLVLDEADRMVEMGFIDDVEKIIKACPKERQTLIFSATMYGPAKKIAQRYMINPITIHATKMVDPSKLTQHYYDVPNNLKHEMLLYLLKQEQSDLVMVFCNTRRMTDEVARVLKSQGIKAFPIHGGLNQSKRLNVIDRFHEGKISVLVCTDVAARGLDIQDVTHVYNFDLPRDPMDYVHRAGRTARAGSDGLVINILGGRDHDNFRRITGTHREFNIERQEKPYLKELPRDVKYKNRGKKGGGRRRSSKGGHRGKRRKSKN